MFYDDVTSDSEYSNNYEWQCSWYFGNGHQSQVVLQPEIATSMWHRCKYWLIEYHAIVDVFDSLLWH